MPRPSGALLARRSAGFATAFALVAALVPAVLGSVPSASAATSQSAAADSVNVTGHGFGHGRGLGQWGSFGAAVNAGWTYRTILGHYYGGSAPDAIADGLISVRLTALDGVDLLITSGAPFSIGGVPIAAGSAGRLALRSDGTFDLFTRFGCGQADAWYAGVVQPMATSTVADPGNDVSKMLQACQPDGSVRSYRGQLAALLGDGAQRAVNVVTMEQYLRGTVPRESPASWADAGGGRGMQAILAQSVAARSYAWGEGGEGGNRYSYAKTCDSTACQVYGGAGLNGTRIEDGRSDAAIVATSGEVRRLSSGALGRTEYSSSTGGYTAGGVFPAVPDDTDSVSPFHDWSRSVPASSIQDSFGVGALQSVSVTARNGLGDGGGRAKTVKIVGSNKTVLVNGQTFAGSLGLRSDWFFVSAGPSGALAWFERNSNTSGVADVSFGYGDAGDIPVACDRVGNGPDTPALFRAGVWHMRNSNSGGDDTTVIGFGDPGDIPVCGDWNGDHIATPGVYRRSTATFYLRNSNTSGVADLTVPYGNGGDIPVVGDWDGDGTTTLGVYRPNAATFYLRNSNTSGVANGSIPLGDPGDFPIVGSWNGAPYTTIGVFRSGTFFLKFQNFPGAVDLTARYGDSGDYPVVGDWNADGVTTPGIVRVTQG
jgi:SpoIID/LytB domain protein